MSQALPPTSIEDLLRERTWIRTLARAMVRDPAGADDVEQEAWVTALRRPPEQGPRLRGWLRRVVRSRAVDGARASTRRQAREVASYRGLSTPTPDDLVEQVELQGVVARGVATLAEPYRLTVLLRYFQGMSAREIADHLEVPLATVRTRLQRAHGMLRERLEHRLGGEGAGWRRGLLLLGADPGQTPWSAASAALKGGLVLTATQKILIACGVLVLAFGGGLVGAWVLQADDDVLSADQGGMLTVDAAPREEAVPVLRVTGTEGEDSTSEVDALREEVRALRAELKATNERLAHLDPALLDRVSKALPGLMAEILRRNQGVAVAVLRNVTSAHAQFQQSGKADTDSDGTGEYGGFLEMSGAVVGRMNARLAPPVLSSRFKTLTENGEALVSGYFFRFYLPDRTGAGVGEPQEGYSRDGTIEADLAETTWCCYAWPVEHGVTGTRTLFMNQGGDPLWTEDPRYSGSGKGPPSDAAFLNAGAITGMPAVGGIGRDGNTWKR